jgi:NTE family protein
MASGKFALALGGGAARGWTHIGILRELTDAGLSPDIVVGTSIGAIVGGHFAANLLDELELFARSLTRRKVFGYLDLSVTGSGLITGDRLFARFDGHLKDLRIENLPTRFAAIATDLATGNEIWLRRGRVTDAVRASSAIPGIVRPVSIRGRWLIDGCLVNPIPVSVCRALGGTAVVAVNLTSQFGRGGILIDDDDDYEVGEHIMKDDAQLAGWSANGTLKQLFGSKKGKSAAPGITSVMMDSFGIFHDRIARARLMGDPPDLLVSPDVSDIAVMDFHRAEEMIESGKLAIRPHLPIIERFLRTPLRSEEIGRLA